MSFPGQSKILRPLRTVFIALVIITDFLYRFLCPFQEQHPPHPKDMHNIEMCEIEMLMLHCERGTTEILLYHFKFLLFQTQCIYSNWLI